MMTILVVDDSLVIRNEMRSIIELLGHNAILAENGKKAIKLYESEKPDLVTMDMAMPVVDGLTALKNIISMDSKAKVIMSTSNSFKEKVIESIKAGALGYMLKPITMDKMKDTMSKVFNEEEKEEKVKAPSDKEFKNHLFDDF